MNTRPRPSFLFATMCACCLLAFSGAAQSPPAAGAVAPEQPAGRGGGGQAQDLTGADFSPKPPITARSAREQANTFLLPAGYRLELVAADPDLNNPAVIEWDGNGRMYVSEFRSYMRDADAVGEHEPTSRVSRWESTKGDGTYDRHTVFADNVLFPRMILPLDGNCILTNETHSDDVVKYCDTNDDGKADKRDIFYSGVGVGRDGNVEHEQSGFIWGLDNWIYSTYNSFRFRWSPGGVQREPTAPNGASWGLTQDDDGKMWFINAGGERGPVNFQFPIHYGALSLDDGFEPGFDTVWPAPAIADMQGGMRRVRQPIGALNHFTATAGAQIVRTDRYPPDMRGDLLFAEPVGRLIRRARLVKTEGLTQLRNVYPGAEFVLGTDPLFRPVNLKLGPDGAIYVADMYHGIIQEAQWTPRGSYLRAKIEQHQLDKITDYGRIWRLRFDGRAAIPAIGNSPAQPAVAGIPLDTTRPRMLNETAAQLVRHLDHPNGWWRDTAQRLLILKQDRSVVPALQRLAAAASTPEGRFHALWTLEGLRALDASFAREQMKDASPRMRVQAIRASETLYKSGDKSFGADYKTATRDPDVDVAIQAMLTLNVLKVGDAASAIQATMSANKARGVQEIGKFLLTPAPATATAGRTLTAGEQQAIDRGAAVYSQLCFTCHAEDGRGTPLGGAPAGSLLAPSLAGSPRVQGHRDYVIKTLIHGLSGPIADQSFPQVMIPMGAQTDQWIADIGSYIRNAFGNSGTFISPNDVTRVRADTKDRKTPWTAAEIERALPVLMQSHAGWKASASHNTAAAAQGLTLAGWTSTEPQRPGMWFQVELPEAATVTEVQFDAAGGGRLGGGGGNRGRGRGARGAAPGAAETAGADAGDAGVGRGGAPAVIGYARQFRVELSLDGHTWQPVAEGSGAPLTTAAFKPGRAKYVRISQTAEAPAAPPWVVQNLRIFRTPGE
jgi:mono/diheme cytochrome c family protein